jgi:hypothetical protein
MLVEIIPTGIKRIRVIGRRGCRGGELGSVSKINALASRKLKAVMVQMNARRWKREREGWKRMRRGRRREESL